MGVLRGDCLEAKADDEMADEKDRHQVEHLEICTVTKLAGMKVVYLVVSMARERVE